MTSDVMIGRSNDLKIKLINGKDIQQLTGRFTASSGSFSQAPPEH